MRGCITRGLLDFGGAALREIETMDIDIISNDTVFSKIAGNMTKFLEGETATKHYMSTK